MVPYFIKVHGIHLIHTCPMYVMYLHTSYMFIMLDDGPPSTPDAQGGKEGGRVIVQVHARLRIGVAGSHRLWATGSPWSNADIKADKQASPCCDDVGFVRSNF